MDHQQWVRRLMARLAPMAADPDDLAQDVFVVVLKRLGSFDLDEDFRAWVCGIARNISRRAWESSRVRREHWQPLVDQAVDSAMKPPSPPEQAMAAQAHQAVRECMDSLGPDMRDLLNLRYRDQMTSATIAENLRRKPSSVRMTLTRIRVLLRDCLKQKGIIVPHLPGDDA